jgi:epoxyqueuosine reductase
MINNKEKYTQFIKAESKRLGFLSCGISKVGFLESEAPRLEKWLNHQMNGQLSYM